jgi:hypothetical protein
MNADQRSISIRRAADDREAVLVIDGEPVDRDAQVTLPAWAIAALAYGGVQAGSQAGAQAGVQAGVKAGAQAIARSRRTYRAVERDEQGRIVGMFVEPAL